MSDISVRDASDETLLNELIARNILNVAQRLETYVPSQKEKILATGIAYSCDNPQELLADLLAQQYAYERVALKNTDYYSSDEYVYEVMIKGEGTE